MKIIYSIVALALLTVSFQSSANAESASDTSEIKAVLVTGASTGIGRKITEVLAGQGYYVYAGARKPADLAELDMIENVQSIRLDVTIQEEIDAAVETVRKSGLGLYGLVNNAGVFIGGPVTEVSDDEFEWLMDVNVFGVYRVTQAFAPLIIESQGRIVNIGSISGVLSGTFFSQYSMSKHAIEAFTDSLALEMARFDVQVSVIEPGNYNSKIVATAYERMEEKGYVDEDSPYAEDYQGLLAWGADRSKYKEPDEVAEAAVHALSDPDPKRRYMVVPDLNEATITIAKAIEELVQLNEWQAYSFSRDELIAMLDEAMAPPE